MGKFIETAPYDVQRKFAQLAASRQRGYNYKSKGDKFECVCPHCGKPGSVKADGVLMPVTNPRGYIFTCPRCHVTSSLRSFLKAHTPDLYQDFLADVRAATTVDPDETLKNVNKKANAKMRERFAAVTDAPPSDFHVERGARTDTTGFPLTDEGNGECFAALYADRVRYDPPRARWLLWAEHYWTEDTANTVSLFASSMARQRREDAARIANPDVAKRALKWAFDSESSGRMKSTLVRAAAQRALIRDTWDEHPMLLGTPNGVVDLAAATQQPGRPEDGITLVSRVAYDEHATCPRWERFITEIFGGDTDLVRWVHKAIGYSLTGDTREHVVFLCHGKGSNGKSTFADVLQDVLGDYSVSLNYKTFTANSAQYDLATLPGKRLAVLSEVPEANYKLESSIIKSLTGSDVIRARQIYKESTEFVPVAKFWMLVNHLPTITDDSHGMWRRVKLIPFLQTFAVDKTLMGVLKQEASGILAWCIRGAALWHQEGLSKEPACVIAATERYREDQDVLADFLASECVIDATASVKADKLYERYRAWADHACGKGKGLSPTTFGRKIGERYDKRRKAGGVFYHGLALKAVTAASLDVTG